MEDKEKNQIKYAIVYGIIMQLYEKGELDKAMAERINSKCAEQLECREMAIR